MQPWTISSVQPNMLRFHTKPSNSTYLHKLLIPRLSSLRKMFSYCLQYVAIPMELQNMSLNRILKIMRILSVLLLGKIYPLLTRCTRFLLFLFHATFFLASTTTDLLYLFNDAVSNSEGTASKVRRSGKLFGTSGSPLTCGNSFVISWNDWEKSQTFSSHFYRAHGQHLNPAGVEYDLGGFHDAVDGKPPQIVRYSQHDMARPQVADGE